ncbi:hypothetical protein [Methanosarcina sp. 1.H.T.1A.1]|uniref:hypothetical protein n=1 Tax=Methanosarcina sp. 1.H.T.1A.1 TaxID=1483602 RepID=UPI000AF47F9D|nr:hypothetical protein [Methanosarcina sp. 1.H.T.1A.1]
MGQTLEFKKLVKYEGSSSGYPVTIRYTPSSNTHVIISEGAFKKNDFFLKRFTPVLIRTFGEPFISFFGKVPDYLISILYVTFLILIAQFQLSDTHVISLILISVPLIFVVFELISQLSYAGEYYRDILCEKCGNEFSCEETKVPEIQETSTPYQYTIQVTRHWKCRTCGFINIRKSSEGFTTKKGSLNRLSSVAKIPCKRCGKTGAYVEYKDPDKSQSKVGAHNEFVTRRYYRCKFCKYEDIKAVQEDVYPADNTPGPSGFGYHISYEDYK